MQDTVLFELTGPAASILTAERTALNFLQTLSATATAAHHLHRSWRVQKHRF